MSAWPWAEPDGSFVRHYNWCFASTCDAGCPYCFSRDYYRTLVAGGARWWTDAEAVAAWAAVADEHGEGFIFYSGLEPGYELPLVGAVGAYHRGVLQTNLSCGAAEVVRWLCPDRVVLHPTFHPHLWGEDIGRFMAEVAPLQEAGFEVPVVAIVAWPPYLSRLAAWVAVLRGAGINPLVSPARAATFEGRDLPEGYTPAERALLAEYTGVAYTDGVLPRPLRIVACGAGMGTVNVMLNGDVWRCGQLRGMGETQNLMRDRRIVFDVEPQPCSEQTCRCGHLHRYHITEGVVQ